MFLKSLLRVSYNEVVVLYMEGVEEEIYLCIRAAHPQPGCLNILILCLKRWRNRWRRSILDTHDPVLAYKYDSDADNTQDVPVISCKARP